MITVTKATAQGTCFGVQDAIDIALGFDSPETLTILGQLVHNPQTVARLTAAGVRMVENLAAGVTTPQVMITAHGAAETLKAKARALGLEVYDATCPLVTRVHKAVKYLAKNGYFPIVIGKAEHVEVKGIVGDLEEYLVVRDIREVKQVAAIARPGIVSQTTNRTEDVAAIVAAIEAQEHEAIKYIDTICQPVKDRQAAARELAARVDVMIVIGGYNSSNTKKLKELAQAHGVHAYHIEHSGEIDAAWFAAAQHIGITAGTSTPHQVIDEVYLHVCGMVGYAPTVEERKSTPDKLVQISVEKERAKHRLQKQMATNADAGRSQTL